MAEKTYWAAEPLESFLPKAIERRDAYYRHVESNGLLRLWRQNWRAAYPALESKGALTTEGDEGEFVRIDVAEYGNLKTHVLTMVTGQKLYPECKAANTDHRSQQQTILGQGIAEMVLRDKGLAAKTVKATDFAVMFSEGWIGKFWDRDAGYEYAVDEAPAPATDPMNGEVAAPPPPQIVRSGDIKYACFDPLGVVRDVTRTNIDDAPWLMCRTATNRYDLKALYPSLGEEIDALPSIRDERSNVPRIADDFLFDADSESDEVWVWDFWHKDTPAVPGGRHIRFSSATLAFDDEPLPYKELPLYRMSGQDVAGTTLAYSNHYDLLSIQEALSNLYSSALSSIAAFGMPAVWIPDGCVLQKTQIGKALALLEGGTTKPEPVEWATVPNETFKLIEILQRLGETESGVNPVVRGNPEANLKSGTALALVQAQAIQFVTMLKQAYVEFVSKILTGTVRDYQAFAEAPQIMTITGSSKKQQAVEFTKDDIDGVDSVIVDIGNPLQGTIAGRSQMAETLVQARLITTPEQYIQVVTTGRLEPMIEATQLELLNIKSENERLGRGEMCSAVYTDNHPIHIREHAAVLASPEARENPAVVQAVDAHLNDPMNGHAALWRNTDPAILMALQIQPPPMPAMPGMPGMEGPEHGGEKRANGSPRKAPALPGDKQASDTAGPGMQQAEQMGIPMPNMPQPPPAAPNAAQIGSP